jgi:hypothetical protein
MAFLVDRFNFYFEANSQWDHAIKLYIIMGYYLVECFPVACVLLCGKKKKTYARMINELKKAALPIKLEL